MGKRNRKVFSVPQCEMDRQTIDVFNTATECSRAALETYTVQHLCLPCAELHVIQYSCGFQGM